MRTALQFDRASESWNWTQEIRRGRRRAVSRHTATATGGCLAKLPIPGSPRGSRHYAQGPSSQSLHVHGSDRRPEATAGRNLSFWSFTVQKPGLHWWQGLQ